MTTFTLTTPTNVGTLTVPVVVSSLNITALMYTTTPALAPLGTAQLSVTITDPASGWQETISYQDASVLAFFSQLAPTTLPAGTTLDDVMCQLTFAKLIADGKLPSGTVTTAAS
jgi:hypothetical protein